MPPSRFHDMLTTMPAPVVPSKLCCSLNSRFLPLCLYPSPRYPAFSVIACLLRLCRCFLTRCRYPAIAHPNSQALRMPSKPRALSRSLCDFCHVLLDTTPENVHACPPRNSENFIAILRSLLPSLFKLFLHPYNETLVHFTSLSGWSDVID